MKIKLPLISVLLLALSTPVQSMAADSNAGQALYSGTCAACHGAKGEGNPALKAPTLAGQQAAYLQRQLQHFRDGARGTADGDAGGAMMAPMAKSLADDAAVEAVAGYLASLPAVQSTDSSATGDVVQGGKLYQSKCGACHGGKGEGNLALNSPRLAGQSDSYLQTQFANFKQGKRGYSPQDKFGRQMKMMANSLDEAQLQDVLAYLNTLSAE